MIVLLVSLAMASAAETGDGSYRLGAGDTVHIEVYNEEDLSREVQITASCTVQMPLIGAVQVCGITTDEAAARIRERLSDGYLVEPAVFVDVAAYGSQRVEVKGEVKKPGVHVLAGPTTLSEIITTAGGPTSPNVMRVQLISDEGMTEYTLPELDARKEPVWIEPGQTVVLLAPVVVQVFGEVKKSGPVAFRPGMTATEVLGLAGGPSEFAGLRRAYVLRADGVTRVKVNFRRIQAGRAPDVVLEPGDQLVVRRSFF